MRLKSKQTDFKDVQVRLANKYLLYSRGIHLNPAARWRNDRYRLGYVQEFLQLPRIRSVGATLLFHRG